MSEYPDNISREKARSKYASFLADFTVADADEVLDVLIERDALRDRISTLEQNIKLASEHLTLGYRQAPDGMLPPAVSDAKQVLAAALRSPTKTLKLSGNMVDATDRDLLGNPTLEGDCRL